MAGYSNTPLLKKLGIKENFTICVVNSPKPYASIVANIPETVDIHKKLCAKLDLVHIFSIAKMELQVLLPEAKKSMKPDGMIWISWPKKSSKMQTDITEDTIREVCLPLDLVDIKVCAIDDIWSGLKLVIRKEKR